MLVDRSFHESSARLASLNHQGKDRITVNPGQTFAGSNRHSFQEHQQDFRGFLDVGLFTGSGVWLDERLGTSSTAKSLESVAILTELSSVRSAGWGILVDEFNLAYHDVWTIDELLLHPREAIRFCDDVRHKRGYYDVPDDVILRAIIQRRKNP